MNPTNWRDLKPGHFLLVACEPGEPGDGNSALAWVSGKMDSLTDSDFMQVVPSLLADGWQRLHEDHAVA